MYQDSNCQRQAASVVALMPTLLLYDPTSLATISLGKASNLEGWILAISQLDLVFKSKGWHECHYVLVSYISHEKQVVVYLPEVIKQIAYSMSFLHQLPNLFPPMFHPIFFPRNHPPRASNLVKKSQGQPSTSDMSAQPLKFSDSVRHCKKTSKETSPRFSALKAAISARISLPDMTWTNMVEKKNMGENVVGSQKRWNEVEGNASFPCEFV